MTGVSAGLLARAWGLHDFGRPEAALEEFDRVLAREPDNTEALRGRGLALCALDRYEEALDSFQRLLALDPDNPTAHGSAACVLLQLGRADEALHAANAMLQRQPDHPLGHTAAALAMAARYQRGGPDAPLMQANTRIAVAKAQELGPQSPEIWHYSGVALGLIGDTAGMDAALEKALSLDPQHEDSLFQLALSHAAKRRLRPALRLVESLLAINPRAAHAPHLIVAACGTAVRRLPLASLAAVVAAALAHLLEANLDVGLAWLRIAVGGVLAVAAVGPTAQLLGVPEASRRFLRDVRGFPLWRATVLLLPATALAFAWLPWPVAATALAGYAVAVSAAVHANRRISADLDSRYGTPDRS